MRRRHLNSSPEYLNVFLSSMANKDNSPFQAKVLLQDIFLFPVVNNLKEINFNGKIYAL